MANKILLASTLCSTICHLTAFLLSVQLPPTPYIIFIVIALITSIWNHSTTSELAKWSDRIIIGCGAVITYTIAPLNTIYFILPIAVGSYGLAKKMNNCIPHIIAHISLTGINMYILMNGF